MRDVSILLIGNTDRAEFRQARAALERLAHLTPVGDLETALVRATDMAPPADVIVLAQAFPGEFSCEAVDRLRARAPLARIVGLLGSWCEGEVRSGQPWPGAIRLYAHQWLARAEQELRHLASGSASNWSLPVTASEEERFLAAADEPLPRREGLVAIHCRQYDAYDWLAGACRRVGYETVWLRANRSQPSAGPSRHPAAVIADLAETDSLTDGALGGLVERLRPAPVLAMLDFPRVEDCDRALAAGAAAVLSKPLVLADLFWHLDRVRGVTLS